MRSLYATVTSSTFSLLCNFSHSLYSPTAFGSAVRFDLRFPTTRRANTGTGPHLSQLSTTALFESVVDGAHSHSGIVAQRLSISFLAISTTHFNARPRKQTRRLALHHNRQITDSKLIATGNSISVIHASLRSHCSKATVNGPTSRLVRVQRRWCWQ